MLANEISDLSTLTWVDLKTFYPVANSDRRKLLELMEEELGGEDYKDDEVFYSAFLHLIEEDVFFLVKSDLKLIEKAKPKAEKKMFLNRVCTELARRANVEPWEVREDAGELFEPGTKERNIHLLLLRVCALCEEVSNDVPPSVAEEEGEEEAPEETREEAPDWDDCLGRVKGLVDRLEGPDSDLVLDLLETVQKLQEACDVEERRREEKEAAVWGRRRAELCAILDSLEIDGTPAPSKIRAKLEVASAEILKRVEQYLVVVEEAVPLWREHCESRKELKQEWNALYDREDDQRLEQVNEELKVLKKKETEEFTRIRAALDGAASALGHGSDVELEGEDAVAPQGSEDSSGPAEEAPNSERETGSSEEVAEPELEPVSDDAPAIEDAARPATESEGMIEEESKAAEADTVEPRISEEADGQEEGPAPQPTAPVEGLDQRIAALMDANEEALAYHLVALAEERGLEVPIPASVLEGIVTARCVMGPYEQASAPVGKILAQAVSEIEALVDGEESSHIVHGALFAALVRPAILSADTNARIHLQNLSIRGELACLAKLHSKLSGLGHSFQPRVEDLQKIAGANQGLRLSEAKDDLESWVEQARSRHHAHNPTTHILHNLVAPEGRFGSVVTKALVDDRAAVNETRELLELYENKPGEIEDLVHECERLADRPFKDRIREKALTWIQKILLDGCERLHEWLAAKEAEVGRLDDRRVAAMQRTVSALTKACEKALGELPDQEASGLAGAVNRSIRKAIEAAQALLSGAQKPGQHSLSMTRRADLLKLPAGCLPLAPEPGEGGDLFAEERQRQSDCLFDTLLSYARNPGVGWTEALKARLVERAIGPARELIKLHRRRGLATDAEIEDFEAELAEARAAAAREVTERCTHLERSLTQLASLDLKHMKKTREGIDRVRSLKHAVSNGELPFLVEDRRPGVPADFPQAMEFLGTVENLHEEVRRAIAADQRMRLQLVGEDQVAIRGKVEEILKTLDERDPNTIEDMIASLQAGKPISSLEIEESRLFERFFPDFVERMSAEDAPKNAGQILSAIRRNEPIAGLDISALDEDHRENAQQLIARWGDVRSRFERPALELNASASQLLESCGFTSVELSGGSWIVSKQFRRFAMRCNVPKATTWFLPPEYGSITNGAYRLYVCRSSVPNDQIEAELGKSAEEGPPILLFLGRMTRARRHDFAQRMRNAHQPILLLDETLLLFLAQSAEARLETLFECTMPFGYTQPYTTDPGDIPAEMFFGRREEIRKIAQKSADGCLVYGGRQLGKSALLHQVRKLYHAPEKGFVVCYLSCDSIGGIGTPASVVWPEIAKILSEFGITRDEEGAPEQIRDAIRAWLREDTQRRILVLLDETDLFMSAEARSNFAQLTKLKELMETTGRRFKVVFAGLHNVRRALKAPNSPLAHLGEPICVGPLNNSTEDMEGARRLVVGPMRAAGFEYEAPQLGWDILANVNHYPSLVQVFCKELLNGLHRRKMLPNSGPRWTIDRKTVFEGRDHQQIAESIRRKFLLTLSLDPRYELVANVLALFRITDGDEAVLRRGIDVPTLFEEVKEFWPENLQQLDRNAFTGLLDEMVDLGVLSCLGSRRNRYGLRTSHVAQMLGTQEEIEDTIQQLMDLEPRIDYDMALYCRPIRIGNPMQRSPFSDQQLSELFDLKNPGYQIVAGTVILGIESAVEALEAIAPDWHKEGEPRREVRVIQESGKQFRSVLSRVEKRGRPVIVIVAPAAGWDEQWLKYAAQQKGVQSGVVRPIFVADGVWLREKILTSECELPWKVITPRPWGHQMLRAHLDETEGVMLDHKELRQTLLNGSGGVPERLVAACAELQEQYRNGNRDLEKAVGEWAVEQAVSLEEVGLDESFGEIVDTLDDCLPEEIPVFREIWADAGHALTFNQSVRLFAALGLLDPVDPERSGIRFTVLGRLLKRSL